MAKTFALLKKLGIWAARFNGLSLINSPEARSLGLHKQNLSSQAKYKSACADLVCVAATYSSRQAMYERNLVSALFCYFGVWNLGEAFLDKASTFYTQLKARMLRPYKNRGSFAEITKEASYSVAFIRSKFIRPLAKIPGRALAKR